MPSRWPRRLVSGWTLLVFGVLYLPLVVVVLYACNANPRSVTDWAGFTTHWFGDVVADDDVRRAVATSLRVALPSALLATLLGTAAALGLRSATRRAQLGYEALAYLTLVTPAVVLGLSALIFYVNVGVQRGTTAIALSHAVFDSSIVLLLVRARMDGLSDEPETAALDLGASRWGVLWQVSLPRLAPAIAAGALLAFTFSWDDYVVASFVAGPEATTLPIYLFSQLRFGLTPAVNALGALMLAFNVLAIGCAALLMRRRARRPARRDAPVTVAAGGS